jgi:hypothetical protein
VFKQSLKAGFGLEGYICIKQKEGQWTSDRKMIPIEVYSEDYVTLSQDDEGNQGYDETILAKHIYLDEFNVWEAMIRDALTEGRIPVDDSQIHRILTPILSDDNNNLLHHLCYAYPERLTEIIELPGFHQFYSKSENMFPIFFNFNGQSPISLALAARDNESFYILLDTMLEY